MAAKRTGKPEGSVRAFAFEIISFAGDQQAARMRWREMQDDVRELANVVWQTWETWHVQRGNHTKVKDFMRDLANYRQSQQKRDEGDAVLVKPKLEVQCWPSDCGKAIYAAVAKRFRSIHSRTQVLAMNMIHQRMGGKDANGRWTMWQAVLAGRQGRPSAERDQPIPFDAVNCSLPIQVDRRERGIVGQVDIRLTAYDQHGKKVRGSLEDTVRILAKGSGQAIMERIANGEYSFRGSQVTWHRGKRKFFLSLAYQMPPAVKGVPGEGSAYLWPDGWHPSAKEGYHSPWRLWIPSQSKRMLRRGGSGRPVIATRQRVLSSRWTEQETYRWAGRSRKSHGRKRALGPIEKLRNHWRNFSTSYNHAFTTEIVRECVSRKLARLVYFQPTDARRETRFLSNAGKIPCRRDSTIWDWAQVATMLGYKCKEAGIHLVVKKGRERRGDDVQTVTKNKDLRARKNNRSQKATAAVVA